MKHTILLFLLVTSSIFGTISTVVSIAPEHTFVKAIGGDKVTVSLMVKPGNSPHTYEPKPSQMMAITKADLYFAIDIEFEHIWLDKFRSLNQNMKIISLSEGISKIRMKPQTQHANHNDHDTKDPHIWTSPSNVKHIVKHIYTALSSKDPQNRSYYKKNLQNFISHIDATDTRIKHILSLAPQNKKFMTVHPSWAYFAKEYNLEQLIIQKEGKSPKLKELIALIKKSKKEYISTIVVQNEFTDTSAKIIAKELSIQVQKISPLALNWADNLIALSKAIAGQK
ncbi:MAG: zinc ABC transporter substrate-binding protein [Epsilonproteobacteria bacterium]|nr:MAG: zinc ABC transporter substrate-binding protein [Campylobacterota bacterium]